MASVPIEPMRVFAQQLFERIGTTSPNASVVSDHLIESSLRGMHSHGVIRIPQYLDEAATGAFDPAATPKIESSNGARISIAGRRAFGQVGGMLMAEQAARVGAELGCALVTATNLGHTGRIGAYAETVGRAGLVSIWFASGTGLEGRRVAPFRGREPRLSTNPIAYSLPMDSGPVVADFATSAGAEGVVRSLKNRGMQAPPGMLLDHDGHPTTDPNILYKDPAGTIALLGGEVYGHKGFALSMLVEVMSTLVGGLGFDDSASPHNTIAVLACQVDADFGRRLDRYVGYIRSAAATDPNKHVVLPGQPEAEARANAQSVLVDDVTWAQLESWSKKLEVSLPPEAG